MTGLPTGQSWDGSRKNPERKKTMKSLWKLVDSVYAWFVRVANLCQHPFLLAVRLYFGWQFFRTGMGKLADIQKVVDYFTSLNIPAPALNAHFIAWLETIGGIMLMLGLASRLMAIPMAIDMIVAYVVADNEALHSIFSDPDKFTGAAPYNFLFIFLLILFFGPGFFSLDTIIGWLRKKRQPQLDASASAGS
jgi:putative oxidoreductase